MNNYLSRSSYMFLSPQGHYISWRYIQRKADKSSKFCQRRAHLWQKLLYLYAFVYSSLMKTLCRSKHIGGTKVTNDYLLLICNLLDQILYISFPIFRSYFLTTYSGRIRFADATSLFHSTCYAHEVICDLCGWSGNRWRAGGGRDPCPVTPWSLLFSFAGPGELE